MDAPHAGALVVYLYRNKSLEKTNAQLQSIGTVMATNLLMGSIQETAIDNVGAPPSLSTLCDFVHAVEMCFWCVPDCAGIAHWPYLGLGNRPHAATTCAPCIWFHQVLKCIAY